MQNLFDAVNAYLLHHPDLLAYLHWLFWFKSWCLFALMGVFVFLIYREDWRIYRARKASLDCRWEA